MGHIMTGDIASTYLQGVSGASTTSRCTTRTSIGGAASTSSARVV